MDATRSALNRLAILKGDEVPYPEESEKQAASAEAAGESIGIDTSVAPVAGLQAKETKIASPRDIKIRFIESSFDELSKIALANNDEPISSAIKTHVNFLTDAAQGPFHLIDAYEAGLTKQAEEVENTKAILKEHFKTKLAEVQKEAMVKIAEVDGFIDELTKIAEATGDVRLKHIVANPEMIKEAVLGMVRAGKALSGLATRAGAGVERGAAAVGRGWRGVKAYGAQQAGKTKHWWQGLSKAKKWGIGLGSAAAPVAAVAAPMATAGALGVYGAARGIRGLWRAGAKGHKASALKRAKDAKFVKETAKGGATTNRTAAGELMPGATALGGRVQQQGFQQAAKAFDNPTQYRAAQKLMKQTGKPIRNQAELNTALGMRPQAQLAGGGGLPSAATPKAVQTAVPEAGKSVAEAAPLSKIPTTGALPGSGRRSVRLSRSLKKTRAAAQTVEKTAPAGMPLTQKAQSWWTNLTPGEQKVLLGGAVAGAAGHAVLS